MPEGDAVRRTALRLDRALAGQVLTVGQLRVPRYATVDLAGSTVVGTAVRGKHLLTRLLRKGRPVTLHSHLRMDGRWVVGEARDRPVAGPGHQIRAWLMSTSDQAVGLRLAGVEVRPTADEGHWVGHLGPDVLADDFDAQEGARRLARSGERPIGEALLDQTLVCGLGTMWVSECLFAARAHPLAPAAVVIGIAPALAEVRAIMTDAVTGTQLANRRRLRVYARDRQPCPRCGTVIRTLRVGRPPTDRQLYYCPTCQPVATRDP